MNVSEGYIERLNKLLDDSNHIKFSNPQKALDNANFVYVRSLKAKNQRLEAKSLFFIGLCNELLSNYPEAMKNLSEAIKLASEIGEKKIVADSLNCAGIIHDNLNNYSKSLKTYLRALKIYEDLNLNKNAGIILSNIGLIYSNINDYKNALKYYSQALDIAEELGDEESLLITNINLGHTHKLLGNYRDSQRFLNDAIEIAVRKNDLRRKSIALDLIADVNAALNDLTGARNSYNESLKIKSELNDSKGIAAALYILGELDIRENRLDDAKEKLNKSLLIFEELKHKKPIYQLHRLLSKIYEKEKSTEKALEHYKLSHEKELEFITEESEALAKNIEAQLEIEQVQQEAEIQRLRNIELAKALDEVKKLNISLKELNDEKNEFMAIAVHDLKNPLQSILSSVRILKKTGELHEEGKEELVTNILSQTSRMFGLIKKLLDHNAIEERKIKIKKTSFDAGDLTGELVNNFKSEADKKELELVYEENPLNRELYTDREILYEILENLLSNAVKFSPKGKKIFFKTSSLNDIVNFEISDEGPGFTEKDREKIFTKFARLSAKPTGEEHSTGLGLSIVKRLSELIGAEVDMQSEEGKGAKFTVSVSSNH
ncbi:MAG: tetratricopeptide repeat-containing sensor histidine kinase [Chlorobi bacterium]|nr:tetratricopeptide repeat-containing sensor histidine kinase [Chlorobiota bacterium]